MILGAEIALFLYGLYALFTGKYALGKNRILTGGKARILGLLCLMPIPISFVTGIIASVFYFSSVSRVESEPPPLAIVVVEVVILVGVVIIVSVLGKMFYKQQEAAVPLNEDSVS